MTERLNLTELKEQELAVSCNQCTLAGKQAGMLVYRKASLSVRELARVPSPDPGAKPPRGNLGGACRQRDRPGYQLIGGGGPDRSCDRSSRLAEEDHRF